MLCSCKRVRAAKESMCQDLSYSVVVLFSVHPHLSSHSVGQQQLSTFLFTNACGPPTTGFGEKFHMISEMFAATVDNRLKFF